MKVSFLRMKVLRIMKVKQDIIKENKNNLIFMDFYYM